MLLPTFPIQLKNSDFLAFVAIICSANSRPSLHDC